ILGIGGGRARTGGHRVGADRLRVRPTLDPGVRPAEHHLVLRDMVEHVSPLGGRVRAPEQVVAGHLHVGGLEHLVGVAHRGHERVQLLEHTGFGVVGPWSVHGNGGTARFDAEGGLLEHRDAFKARVRVVTRRHGLQQVDVGLRHDGVVALGDYTAWLRNVVSLAILYAVLVDEPVRYHLAPAGHAGIGGNLAIVHAYPQALAHALHRGEVGVNQGPVVIRPARAVVDRPPVDGDRDALDVVTGLQAVDQLLVLAVAAVAKAARVDAASVVEIRIDARMKLEAAGGGGLRRADTISADADFRR